MKDNRQKINKKKIKELQKEVQKKNVNKIKIFLKKTILITITLIIICLLYARFVEPYFLLVHEYKITDIELPDSFHGTKIVHFSDLHYGSTINKNNINNVLNKINELKPDIVVFTGDLVERNYILTESDQKTLQNFLNSINYTLGKYTIWGNHDITNKNYKSLFDDTNFIFLENNYEIIYNKDLNSIAIFGCKLNCNIDLDNDIENIMYRIALTHEPDNSDTIIANYNADLILAGHSHNGQVKLPFFKPLWLPDGSLKYYAPYYNLSNTPLYISNGIGTSTLRLRFNSIPSINLYRLTNK